MKLLVDQENPAKKAGETLNWLLCKYEDRPVLLLVSGGSALNVLEYVSRDILEPSITISVVDERFTTERSDNNFTQLSETEFFDRAVEKNCAFISTEVHKTQTMAELTDQLERHLHSWKTTNPEGIVIVLLGIGEDGHIAGMMPYPENARTFSELFEDKGNWVVGYDAKDKSPYPLRVTTTNAFLKEAVDHAVVYAVGDSKREAIKRSREAGPTNEVPARILKEISSVTLVTDQDL